MLGLKNWSLIKRLKRILKKLHTNEGSSALESDAQGDVKSTLHALTKKLSKQQLESLLTALESGGQIDTQCILLPDAGNVLHAGKKIHHFHAFLCYLCRWPSASMLLDLMTVPASVVLDNTLKRLHYCDLTDSANQLCCNPYHWSRLLIPDLPPPPYSAISSHTGKGGCDRVSGLKPCDISTESDCTFSGQKNGMLSSSYGSDGSIPSPFWCNLAYWELLQRVGPLHGVSSDAIDIFQHLPQRHSQGHGMCLSSIQEHHYNQEPTGNTSQDRVTPRPPIQQAVPPDDVRRTRDKIGAGATIYRDRACRPDAPLDGVNGNHEKDIKDDSFTDCSEDAMDLGDIWLYNRSDQPLFVNSPTYDMPCRHMVVLRVAPGYSVKIFSYKQEESRVLDHTTPPFADGPYDTSAVRVSFAKGWGDAYKRQFITSCPCWLEVLLKVPR